MPNLDLHGHSARKITKLTRCTKMLHLENSSNIQLPFASKSDRGKHTAGLPGLSSLTTNGPGSKELGIGIADVA